MNRFRSAMITAGLCVLLALSLTGCSNDDESKISGAAPTLGGVLDQVPELSGSWTIDTTVTKDTCGALSSPLVEDVIVEIVSAATALDLDIHNICGTLIGEGTGDVNASDVVTATTMRTVVLTSQCTLVLEETLTGTVNGAADLITGSSKLTVSEDPAPGISCGAGFPCTIDSTFVAAKCPPADCTFQACP